MRNAVKDVRLGDLDIVRQSLGTNLGASVNADMSHAKQLFDGILTKLDLLDKPYGVGGLHGHATNTPKQSAGTNRSPLPIYNRIALYRKTIWDRKTDAPRR